MSRIYHESSQNLLHNLHFPNLDNTNATTFRLFVSLYQNMSRDRLDTKLRYSLGVLTFQRFLRELIEEVEHGSLLSTLVVRHDGIFLRMKPLCHRIAVA